MYTKHTWLPRLGTGLNKFANSGDASHLVLTPEPDTLTQEGTPFSATWMNELEGGTYYANRHLGAVVEDITAGKALYKGEPVGICDKRALAPGYSLSAIGSALTVFDADADTNKAKTSFVWLSPTRGVLLRGRTATVIHKDGTELSVGSSTNLSNAGATILCGCRLTDDTFAVMFAHMYNTSAGFYYHRFIVGRIVNDQISFISGTEISTSLSAYITGGSVYRHGMGLVKNSAEGSLFMAVLPKAVTTSTRVQLMVWSDRTLSIKTYSDLYWNEGNTQSIACDFAYDSAILFYTYTDASVQRARIVKVSGADLSTVADKLFSSDAAFTYSKAQACIRWEASSERALAAYVDTNNSNQIKLVLLSVTNEVSVLASQETTATLQASGTAYAPLNMVKLGVNRFLIYYTGADNKPKYFIATTGESSISVSDITTISDTTCTSNYGLSAGGYGHNSLLLQPTTRTIALYGMPLPEAVAANAAAAGDAVTVVYDGNIYDPIFSEGYDTSASGVNAHAYADGCLTVKGWWK